MSGGTQANVLLVEHRPAQLRTLRDKVEDLGHVGHPVCSMDDVVRVARETSAEVALLHLNFAENGGGIVAGYFLREITRTTRILAYTGDPAGAGLEVARSLGLADRLVTYAGLVDCFDQLIPNLVDGARADRAVAAAIDEAGRPQVQGSRKQKLDVRPIDLGTLHNALDRAVIVQLLDWLGSIRCAARALRMPHQSLRWKMDKLGIEWKSPDIPPRR